MPQNPFKTLGAAITLSLCGLPPFAQAEEHTCAPVGYLVSQKGSVEYHAIKENTWKASQLAQRFCEGDRLRTLDNSQASVRLVNETLVQLDHNTTLNFTRIEAQEHSILDLIKGIIHSISRVPQSLEIRTPYVNAAIEGTEFVVASGDGQADVTVLEGVVRTHNAVGEVRVHAGEAAHVKAGEAPYKEVMIHPQDAVSWSLTYPPILSKATLRHADPATLKAFSQWLGGKPRKALEQLGSIDQRPLTEEQRLLKAAALLSAGRVQASANTLKPLQKNATALSILAIIDLVNNRHTEAEEKISQALATAPDSPTPLVALSYLQQARFEIPAAVESMKKAQDLEPDSALILARYANTLLMNGDTETARKAARQAITLNPSLDTAHMALAFGLLQDKRSAAAESAFRRALELNSSHAHSHLGLGLALIHQGKFTAGREELEAATLLNPNESLLRSYMGKAYFEEYRNELAYKQLHMAKSLDLNDPTPWFYESVVLHHDNRPVEALKSMETSIAKNNNRGVYRSRLLLDDDSASRTVAAGALYQSLGFENLATTPASLSLATKPDTPQAHRLLADSYLGQYRHTVARLNELLQAQLLSDIDRPMLQPQLLRSYSALLDHGGPTSPGYNEFNSLFLHNGNYANLHATAGGNNSLASDLIVGHIDEKYSLHLGQYQLQTDGFQDNQDYDETTTRLEAQWQITQNTKLRMEGTQKELDKGDVAQRFDPDMLNPTYRHKGSQESLSVGFTHRLGQDSLIIGNTSYTFTDIQSNRRVPGAEPFISQVDSDQERVLHMHHLQYQKTRPGTSWLIGAQHATTSNKQSLQLDYFNTPDMSPDLDSNTHNSKKDSRLYGYLYEDMDEGRLVLTAGLELARQDNLDNETDTLVLPKVGLNWQATDRLKVGLASFEALTSAVDPTAFVTLAPTQIAGFDQLFSGQHRTKSHNLGVSLEYAHSDTLKLGLRASRQRASTPTSLTYITPEPSTRQVDIDSQLDNASAWLYWMPSNRISVSLEHQIEDYHDDFEKLTGSSTDGVESLKTWRTPLTLGYHHPSGLSAIFATTRIHQQGVFWEGTSNTHSQDTFWLSDIALNFRFGRHRASISVGVKNLFDTSFHYEDIGSYDLLDPQGSGTPSVYAPERTWFATLSISL